MSRKLKNWDTYILCGLLAAVFLCSWILMSFEGAPGHAALREFLLARLVRSAPLAVPQSPYQDRENIIYILGGSEKTLRSRFKTAAALYHDGLAGKVLILSEPGITEFSPALKRNLTNDEWAAEELAGLGVMAADVLPVRVESGFFGTYTEARGISRFVSDEGYKYKRLILVTSSYHTERAWESFSRSLNDGKIGLFVYPAEDEVDIAALGAEYLKLLFYRIFLL